MSNQYSAACSKLHFHHTSLQTASASATPASLSSVGTAGTVPITSAFLPPPSRAVPVLLNPDGPVRPRSDAISKSVSLILPGGRKDLPSFSFWCSLYLSNSKYYFHYLGVYILFPVEH